MMTNPHRYTLEQGSKKYICPNCNEKKFTRYIDAFTNQHIHETVGKCDRENSCGFHRPPRDYFKDNPVKTQTDRYQYTESILTSSAPIDYLPVAVFDNSVLGHRGSSLFPFLVKLFRESIATMLCEHFLIGCNKVGATVFWQVDIEGKIRQAKVMNYDPVTGRRNKATGAYFAGKKIIGDPNANLQQCFFGEYALALPENKYKTVALVESEKTAVIASVFLPEFIWIATGGKHGCRWTECNVCKILVGRDVILYPDLGAYKSWINKAALLANTARCRVFVSELLEKFATDEDKKNGLDIADFLLKTQDSTGIALTDYGYPVIWDFMQRCPSSK